MLKGITPHHCGIQAAVLLVLKYTVHISGISVAGKDCGCMSTGTLMGAYDLSTTVLSADSVLLSSCALMACRHATFV